MSRATSFPPVIEGPLTYRAGSRFHVGDMRSRARREDRGFVCAGDWWRRTIRYARQSLAQVRRLIRRRRSARPVTWVVDVSSERCPPSHLDPSTPEGPTPTGLAAVIRRLTGLDRPANGYCRAGDRSLCRFRALPARLFPRHGGWRGVLEYDGITNRHREQARVGQCGAGRREYLLDLGNPCNPFGTWASGSRNRWRLRTLRWCATGRPKLESMRREVPRPTKNVQRRIVQVAVLLGALSVFIATTYLVNLWVALGLLGAVAIGTVLTVVRCLISGFIEAPLSRMLKALVVIIAGVAISVFAIVGYTAYPDTAKDAYNLFAQLVVTAFPVVLALALAVSQINSRYSANMADVASDFWILLYCAMALTAACATALRLGINYACWRAAVYGLVGYAICGLPWLFLRLRKLADPLRYIKKLRRRADGGLDDTMRVPLSRIFQLVESCERNGDTAILSAALQELSRLASSPRDLDSPHSITIIGFLQGKAEAHADNVELLELYLAALVTIAVESDRWMTSAGYVGSCLQDIATLFISTGKARAAGLAVHGLVQMVDQSRRDTEAGKELAAIVMISLVDLAKLASETSSPEIVASALVGMAIVSASYPGINIVVRLAFGYIDVFKLARANKLKVNSYPLISFSSVRVEFSQMDRNHKVIASALDSRRSVRWSHRLPGKEIVIAGRFITSLVQDLIGRLADVARAQEWGDDLVMVISNTRLVTPAPGVLKLLQSGNVLLAADLSVAKVTNYMRETINRLNS